MKTDKFERNRQQKLEQIKSLGIDPYGGRFDDAESLAGIRARQAQSPDVPPSAGREGSAKCAGRIVLLRDIGKLIFITLRDWTGTIQVGLSKSRLVGMESQWDLAKLLEVGDLLGVTGALGKTKTGEITIWGDKITILSKSLLQPPEKFHGLADVDLRYRQRYVDLWANPEVMEKFKKRSDIISSIRQYLAEAGFLEVETPMMQTIAGGAAARPFITHHNSLDMDLYLRIAPELFLKRLLVGGMEKVFEINRNFRNEGLSRRHNPEFTMMEAYQAYADYNVMMDLTEGLIMSLVEKYCRNTEDRRQKTEDRTQKTEYRRQNTEDESRIEFDGQTIDFTKPWRRAAYAELLKEHSGCDIADITAIREKAQQLGIDEAGMDDAVVINEVFEGTVEDKLVNPTFVIDYPAVLCPLTKRKKDNPDYAERFELYIGRMEIANAYTELNDPAVQKENFRIQLKGQDETMATMDEDFINALKYAMPPAGGLGIGIDRLIMVLTGAASIRDVVLFPLLKPEKKNS
ncbi:MAG: lysine--tRNA ligase [Sedimentisphaerales bacterium]|nr:lysine--tRNA ligase [Sedimentisphaerales bacterium]